MSLLVDPNCAQCDLSPFCEGSNASSVVPGWGNQVDPEFIIVAEAPGRTEDREGVPLIGPSGEFLDELLSLAGLSRSQVYITNTVKCWPPQTMRKDGYGGFKAQQASPTKKQVDTCTELYLSEEIDALPGVPIITLGAVPLKWCLPEMKISECHGQVLEWQGRKLIAQFHPAAGLHDPTKRDVIKQDWSSINDKLRTGRRPYQTVGISDWGDVPALASATRVAFDFETTDLRPAFAEIVGVGICIDGDTGYYYTGSEPLGFLDRVNPAATLIAHNAVYEYGIIRQMQDLAGGPSTLAGALRGLESRLEDTMIMARLLSKEFIGLKPLALSELGIKMKEFTDVVKGDIRDADPRVLVEYGGLDVVATFRLWELFHTQLDQREREVYELEIDLIPVVAHLIGEGFRIDTEKLKEIADENTARTDRLREEIVEEVMQRLERAEVPAPSKRFPDRVEPEWSIAGRRIGPPQSWSHPKKLEWQFNPGAPADVQTYFNIASADEDHLLQVDDPLGRKIIEYKKGTKFGGAYVEPIIRSGDRLFGSFNAVGTDTGRFSASGYKLLDSTTVGINLQTAPATIKPTLVADDDEQVLLDLDYSQIELRVLAHVADEAGMKEAYLAGRDLHREMMDRSGVTDRRIAKVMNFSLAYNPEDNTAAYVLIRAARANPGDPIELTLGDANLYVSMYREAWPGIQDYYDRIQYELETREYVETLLGRKYRNTFIDGRSKTIGKKNWEILRKAVNHPIQGGAADIMKLAMRDLWRSRPDYVRFKNTVHDSLVLQTRRDKVEETLLWAMPKMENCYRLSVPIKVEAQIKVPWDSSNGVMPAGEYSLSKGILQLAE